MLEAMQELVEGLAALLKRSVAVDDQDIRLLVCSSHHGDEDPARLRSLVERRIAGELLDYLYQQGVRGFRKPTVIPADARFQMDSRLCFPLRSQTHLLGYMWIIADENTLTIEETAAAEGTAAELTRLLSRRAALADERDRNVERLVMTLLSPGANHTEIGTELARADRFATGGMFAVVVVEVLNASRPEMEWRNLIHQVTSRFMSGRGRTRGTFATVAIDNAAVLLLGGLDRECRTLESLVAQLARELESNVPADGRAAIGIGNGADDLGGVAGSFEQASAALRGGRAAGRTVTYWNSPDVFTMLAALDVKQPPSHLLTAPLDALRNAEAETLILLETYLDTGANAARTAEQMHMHRTSVYYRIDQVERAHGISLGDGETRLQLHLWLKLRRLCEV